MKDLIPPSGKLGCAAIGPSTARGGHCLGRGGPGPERRSMKVPRIVLTGCLVVGTVVALAACGSSSTPSAGTSSSGTTAAAAPSGKTIDIYSSLPLLGPL